MPHSLFKRTTTTEEILLSLKTNYNEKTIKGENNMSYTNNKQNLGEKFIRKTTKATKPLSNKQNLAYTTPKHHNQGNQPYKNQNSHTSNKRQALFSSKDAQNYEHYDDELFKQIVVALNEEEQRIADKTLIPNARNFEKYLFVKKQLSKIAKSNNTILEEGGRGLHADFIIKLYVLDTWEMKILSKINKFCSAIGIDAELNGKLNLCVTVPDVYLVYEDEIARTQNNSL